VPSVTAACSGRRNDPGTRAELIMPSPIAD
jgi:hypothetical protein